MTTATTFAGYDALAQTPPDEERMPFRYIFGERGNLAFLLVLAVLLIGFMVTLAGMAMVMGRTDPLARYELMKMFGIGATILGVIAILISNAANAAGIRKTRHDIKGDLHVATMKVEEMAEKANGGHLAAVREAAEQARAAEREQAVFELLENPKFADLLKRTVESTCAEWDKMKAKTS